MNPMNHNPDNVSALGSLVDFFKDGDEEAYVDPETIWLAVCFLSSRIMYPGPLDPCCGVSVSNRELTMYFRGVNKNDDGTEEVIETNATFTSSADPVLRCFTNGVMTKTIGEPS